MNSVMESFSKALFVCAVSMALYQMSGTPFLLNIAIFCFCTVLFFYALYVSGSFIPTESLYDWMFDANQSEMNKTLEKRNSSMGIYEESNIDDQITKRLRELTGNIVSDFILSWYNTVSNDVEFVQEAFEIFDHLFRESRLRVSKINREKFLSAIVCQIQQHHHIYQNVSQKAREKTQKTILNEDDSKRQEQLTIVSYSAKHGHPALENLPDSELEHLRGLVVLILKALLPDDYTLNKTCLYLVRELIAQNVLNSLVNLLSDPLWIYKTIPKILDYDDEEECSKDAKSPDSAVPTIPEMSTLETKEDNSPDNNRDENNCEMNQAGGTLSHDVETIPNLDIVENALLPLDEMSRSHTMTASQSSIDSSEGLWLSSGLDDDLPLPMTSSQLHFAPVAASTAKEPDKVEAFPYPETTAIVSSGVAPLPDRLFLKIRIPDSKIMQENFDSGGKYTLYRITYKTLAMDSGDGVQSDSNVTEELEKSLENYETNDHDRKPPYKVIKHQVQRRFREFLVLQERLSQNVIAKNLLTDIKGPSRMFPVPFGNMDKDYIEQRRKFLQAYLREVCSIPFISKSREMREFLAYESDPRIAYVKKPDPFPRFDKLLRSAIQDVFGSSTMKFSSTLQLDSEEDLDNDLLVIKRGLKNSSSCDESSGSGPVAKLKNMVLRSSSKLPKLENADLKRKFAPFEGSKHVSPHGWKKQNEIKKAESPPCENKMRFLVRPSGDGCESFYISEEIGSKAEEEGESNAVTSIFYLMLNVWNIKPGTHSLLCVSLHKFVEKYLAMKMDQLTTKDRWAHYLGVLRISLWPNGEWDSGGGDSETWLNASDKIKQEAKEGAQRSLEAALPDLLGKLLGSEAYTAGVRHLVDSFENPIINRHLLYYLLDILVREVFPDINDVISHDNISLSTNLVK